MIVTTISIRCNSCLDTIDTEEDTVTAAEKYSVRKGWITVITGKIYDKHYCPKCKGKQHEKI